MTVYQSLMQPNEVYRAESMEWVEDNPDGPSMRFGSYSDLLDNLAERDGVWSVHDLRDEFGVLQVFNIEQVRD